MSLVVNTNVSSLIAQQNLSTSESSLQTAMQRLSSGLRINSAADDAAGYAIANGMTSQINGMEQAENNANDGVSMVQTASGALQQIDNNLQTIRQLTVEAANGTNSQTDDSYIQTEVNQDLAEIDRVSQQTNFNGVSVLGQNANINIQVGADDGQTISVGLQQIDSSTLGLTSFNVVPQNQTASLSQIVGAMATGDTAVVTPSGGGANVTYTLGANGDFTSSASPSTPVTAAQLESQVNAVGASTAFTIASASTTTGAITVAGPVAAGDPVTITGANTDTGAVTTGNTVFITGSGDLTNAQVAAPTTDPLTLLDSAINQVSQLAANLGATQNRLTSALSDIQTANTNLQSSRSAIQDADYATEVSAMTQAQVLQQAGVSVLSKANQTPQSVLTLLQNA
ncbi:MAG TPA: flagellin [Nevskiaceae bacterium]|nr:flagellin [Nevskiaceae bacterium]